MEQLILQSPEQNSMSVLLIEGIKFCEDNGDDDSEDKKQPAD